MTPDSPFFVGVNLPWLQYGCDFGANLWQPGGGVGRPERRERLAGVFGRLADRNLAVVRWFMFCDGRAGVRFTDDGCAAGLDGSFWRDLEAGIEEAGRHRLSLVLVLFDFTWWRRCRWIEGARCGGHRRATSSRARRDALLERVVAPVLSRCGQEPAITAWDIINEPEWVTPGYGTVNPLAGMRPSAMREFIGECASVVHQRTRHLATVGLASWRGLTLVKGLGLDIYQAHWYDRRERRAPLGASIVDTLDRPLWLGEFPTTGSDRTVDEILDTARLAGYAGALAWSAEAGDRWSNLDGIQESGDGIRSR